MSTTIDQRVVEMRFDNKQFERGVSDTMSTLEKLKQKLNFNGAVKGVENVNSAARNVQSNMGGLSSSVEAVSMRFSALQIMGVTALANITNSAVNAGKRIVSALTIDPVRSGFSEYETQINAVQTILANTSHAGTTIHDVNKALDDLNKYADMTIYNFTEMTRNIGTFTAAGVDLDTSTSAIKGIANLAAVSGSTSQQASTAMYQLSQALAAGRVSLMDWNSVVNAGMGGKVFQDALTRTADVMNNGAASKAIEKYGSFRESLTKGEWLSTDVLTETLNQFTMAAKEGSEEWNKFKAELKEKGYTDEQATAILKMANTATDAATKVKTFTQLWDVLKESAQSGWTQTWELIIGDFEEAKSLLTPISDALTGLIGRMSDFRNAILESALGRTFSHLGDNLKTILKPAAKAMAVVEKTGEALGDLSTIVDDVILGKFGNGKDRVDALTEAGINYYRVQNKVNEELGCAKRFSEEQIAAQDKLLGVQTKSTEKTEEYKDETIKLTDAQKKQLKELGKLSEAELRQKGYTEEQIEALNELKKTAENLGIPFDKFIDQLDEINGRWLLINSFKNIGNALADVGRAIGKAWKDAFPEHSIEYFADKLFNLLGTFHKVTAAIADVFYVKVGENGGTGEAIYKLTDAGEKLVRTFKGVFAALDIVTTIVGGAFKFAFKIVAGLFDKFGMSVLDVTAFIGDVIVGFRDWLDSIFNVSGAVDILVPLIKGAAKFVTDLVNAVKNSKWFNDFCEYVTKASDGLGKFFSNITSLDSFQALVNILKDAGQAFNDWCDGLKEAENIPGYIISGLVSGITNGIPEVISAVFELAKSIIDGICKVLGIHSPSRVMMEIGKNITEGVKVGISAGVDGLINAINAVADAIISAFKTIWTFFTKDREEIDWEATFCTGTLSKIASVLKTIVDRVRSVLEGLWNFITGDDGSVDWGKILSAGVLFSMVWFLKQIATAISGIAGAIGGFGDLIESAQRVLNSFSKVLNSYAWDLKAKAMLKMALAIGVLVLALVILTEIDDIGKLWNAVGIIVALSVVLFALALAMDKFSSMDIDIKDGKINGLKTGLLQIALAIGILAFVVKMISDMDTEKAKIGFKSLAGIAIGMILFLAAISLISKFGGDTSGLSKTMLGLALSLGAMMLVIKLVSKMDPGDIMVGVLAIQAFLILIAEMALINKLLGTTLGEGQKHKGISGVIMSMMVSILLMAGLIKLLAGMDPADITIGVIAIQAFLILITEMALINKFCSSGKTQGIGGTILSMTTSMLLIIGVIRLASRLDAADIIKGTLAIQAFLLLITEMLLISKLGKDTGKVAGTILAMAVSVALLAGIAVALSMVDVASLFKGITAVGALSTLMAIMAKSLKGAQNAKGAVMWMAIGVAILAAAAVALSFVPVDKLLPAVASLSVMMLSFGAMAKMASKLKTSIPSLLIMMGVVAVLAGIVTALSLLNVGSAIEIVTSIGILMVTMGAMLAIISKTGVLSGPGLVSLALMALIVGGIGAIVGGLEKLDLAPSIETAASLSLLLVAMSAALVLLAFAGTAGPAAFIGIGALITMLVAFGLLAKKVGELMAEQPKLEEFISLGMPLIEKVANGIGSIFGNIISGFAKGLTDGLPGIIENIKSFVAGLADVSELASKIEPGSFDGVSDMVGAMMGISIGSLVEHFASKITGESSMDSFKANAIKFVDAMSEISAKLTGASIDEDAIESITKCGKMFAELNNSLPRTGGIIHDLAGEKDLNKFAESCKAFVRAMIIVNHAVSAEGFEVQTDKLSAIVTIGEKFNKLQNALPRTGGVLQDLAGEKELTHFAIACKTFVTVMIGINQAVSAEGFVVQTDKIEDIIEAGEAFAKLNNALPKTGGVAQDLAGEKELGPFGLACSAFTSAMIAVNEAVSVEGFTVNTDAIEQLCIAGEKFNELQNALPKTGGWWETIAGEKDLSDFGGKIKAYGTAISEYSTSVSTIDSAAVNSSIGIAYRIKSLIESLVGLDTSGLAAFTGVGTGGFGADGAAYKVAKAIAKYSEEVAGIDTAAVSVSVSAAGKLKSLIAGLVGLDTSGIENFKPGTIGSAMKSYADKVSGIDTAVVSSSISSANKLKNLITSLVGLDTSGISSFRPQTIGDALKAYGSSVAGMDVGAVNKSVSSASKLKNFISGLAGLNTSGVGSFKKALSDLSTIEVDKIVKAFSGAGPKLNSAGSKMMDGLVKGVTSKTANVKMVITKVITSILTELLSKLDAFNKVGANLTSKLAAGMSSKKNAVRIAMQSCVAAATSGTAVYYTSFYNAGSYLVSGFANGISANSYRAVAKAKAMANAAEKAAREALGINSPSRVFKEIGSGIPEGFAMGIEKMSGLIRGPLDGMANSAIKSVSDTVARLATAIDSDMDVQPTIRPVLDLSDVRSGAGAISGMLGVGSSVGVLANVNSISRSMNARGQNVSNADVVSAIERLDKHLDNVGNTTYTIGGITYDDSSNIASAVRDLTRYARMERRI